jgi:hypothetical protein
MKVASLLPSFEKKTEKYLSHALFHASMESSQPILSNHFTAMSHN